MVDKEQLKEAIALPYVESIEVDESTLIINLDENDTAQTFTVILPDEWPSGEPTLAGDSFEILKPCDSLVDLVKQVKAGFFSSGDGDEDMEDDVGRSASYDDFGVEQSTGFDELASELIADVEACKKKYGDKSVLIRDHFVRLDKAEVDLYIDICSILNPLTADAWGVDKNAPITVTLHCNRTLYSGVEEAPRIECFQTTRKCPLAAQLRSIMQKFAETVWNKTSQELQNMSKAQDKAKAEAQQTMLNSLLSMGFDKGAIERAVSICSTKDEAVELLLSEGQTLKEAALSDEMAALSGKEVITTEYDPNKAIPLRTHGFMVQLLEYVYRRIPTMSSYCVICDRKHMFANTAMLKPSVCSRELCVFGFTELKVGADAADEIAAETGVVDLLICMAKSAVSSSRAEKIFNPYPTVVDPKNTSKFALSPDKKDLCKVRKIFEAFPSVKTLSQANDIGDIKSKLESKEPLAYPLLQWVVSSNRSHMVKLPEQNMLKTMQTQHQYLMISEPPEKQMRFYELKQKYKSKFAWHGSPIENWHSILRNGLQNFSGTSNQLHGAAHGNGIYLAPESGTSLGYSGSGSGSSKTADADKFGQLFIDESKMSCLALCEVIDHDIKDSGWCWVMPHNDHIATRFLFVYDGTCSTPQNLSTKNSAFIAEINDALERNGLVMK